MQTDHCKHCGKEISFYPSSRKTYCDNICQNAYVRHKQVREGTASFRVMRTHILETRTYKCVECGVSSWNDKPIALHLDHIDGNSKNNSLDNLRWLCPNCHSQTPTWGVKNASVEGRERMKTNLRG